MVVVIFSTTGQTTNVDLEDSNLMWIVSIEKVIKHGWLVWRQSTSQHNRTTPYTMIAFLSIPAGLITKIQVDVITKSSSLIYSLIKR